VQSGHGENRRRVQMEHRRADRAEQRREEPPPAPPAGRAVPVQRTVHEPEAGGHQEEEDRVGPRLLRVVDVRRRDREQQRRRHGGLGAERAPRERR
jgi:hypothetical protein